MQIGGRVALVTGGASGLGEATVRHLHAQGAPVVLFDVDAERAKAIAADVGDGVVAVVGNAESEDDAAAAVAAAMDLGGLRHVVACAGGAAASKRTLNRDGTPHDLALFVETLHLNVVSTFNTVRLAAAAMATLDPVGDDGERGAIVTVGSLAGYEGQIGQVAYGAAKAGVIGMTIVLARDLSSVGIRVNCIAPGTIRTRGWDAAPPDLLASLEAKVPFPKRLGKPSEFAALAEHLLTNAYLNGHVARLDGAIRFDPK